jgi:hypothetical protein
MIGNTMQQLSGFFRARTLSFATCMTPLADVMYARFQLHEDETSDYNKHRAKEDGSRKTL